LGSLAGGVSQGATPYIQQLLQQQQANQGQGLAGQALAGMNGVNVPAQSQSPLAGLMSKLGIGGAQPPVQNAPPQQAPAQQPQQQAQPPAQQPQQGGGFMDALAKIESGNRNIPSQTDPDYAGQPGSKSQGFFQIDTPTWRQFAANVPGAAQYPNAMAAPREIQAQVASAIPAARFGPRTQQMLQQQYGTFDLHKTIGELNAQFQGVGRPGGGQQAQPQGQPPQAGQVQQMQLADIVQAMKRAKPDLNGVELMQAVGQILPIMNVQAAQQYHAVQQQLAQQRINQGEEKIQTTQRGQDLSHEDRQAGQSEKRREFDGRQERLKGQFEAKTQQFEEKLQATKDMAERRNILSEANAAIKEQLSAERAEIAASNILDGEARAQLLKEAKDRAEEAKDRVEAAMKLKSVPDSAKSAAPGGKAPERAATPGAVGGYAPKPEAQPAQGKAAPPEMLAQAKEALQNGAPREAVAAKLKELGYSDEGL
jgi:hypothetical protein